LPANLTGLSTEHVVEYVRHCAERLLSMLQGTHAKPWNATQPLAFMEMISIDSKTNFFEARVAEYTMAGVGNDAASSSFQLDAAF